MTSSPKVMVRVIKQIPHRSIGKYGTLLLPLGTDDDTIISTRNKYLGKELCHIFPLTMWYLYTKVGATIPCAATGEKYALSGAVRVEV